MAASSSSERPPLSFPELDVLVASVREVLNTPDYYLGDPSIREALEAICTSIEGRGEIKDQSPENFDIYEPLPWRIFEMRESLEDAMQFLSSASLVTEIEMEESVEGPVLSFVSRLRDWNTSFLDLWNTWKTDPPLDYKQPTSQYITVERSEKLANLCRRDRESITALHEVLDALRRRVSNPVTFLTTPGDFPSITEEDFVPAMRFFSELLDDKLLQAKLSTGHFFAANAAEFRREISKANETAAFPHLESDLRECLSFTEDSVKVLLLNYGEMRATALARDPVGEEPVPMEECLRRVKEDLSTIETLVNKLRSFVPILSYVEDFFVMAAIRLESREASRSKLEKNLEPLLREIKDNAEQAQKDVKSKFESIVDKLRRQSQLKAQHR